MSQEWKDRIVGFLLTLVEVLTVIRTGIDTYAVSQDLLNVILIDGAMLVAWQTVRFGGTGGKALAVRPAAAILAWVLYIQQVVIGFEAHGDFIAIAVRTAGGGLLALDTWSYLVALRQKLTQGSRKQHTQTDWKATHRKAVAGIGYVIMNVCVFPAVWIVQGVRVLADHLRDNSLRVSVDTQTEVIEQTRTYTPATTQALSTPKVNTHVEYTQTESGEWFWLCECEHSSLKQTRGKQTYATRGQAVKGWGGHMQTHAQSYLSVPEIASEGIVDA